MESAALVLTVDAEVQARGKRYRITRLFNFEQVLARDLETGQVVCLPLQELSAPSRGGEGVADRLPLGRDLPSIAESEWDIARQR